MARSSRRVAGGGVRKTTLPDALKAGLPRPEAPLLGRRPAPNETGITSPLARSSLARQVALFSTRNTRHLHGKPRDALGRRAAAGVPDSQSASERGASAKREKPPRTRLASSGGQQPSEAPELAEARERGEFPANGITRCLFYLTRANAREAENRQIFQDSGKYFLECRGAVRTRDLRPRAKPGLGGLRASKPSCHFPT